MTEIRKKNVTVITVDFNASVREDETEVVSLEVYEHCKSNERGMTPVNFCAERKLVIPNTFFRLHNRHRHT